MPFAILAITVAGLAVADLCLGSVTISLGDTVRTLLGMQGDGMIQSIVIDVRLVRLCVALLTGTALSLSGLQMQTLFRNPLAGPYVLGVASGASLGVALFILGVPVLGLSVPPLVRTLGMAGAAWIGAGAVLLAVVAASRRIKDIMVILILGIMLSSVISAIVEILQFLSPENSLKSFIVWTMGSLGDVTYPQLEVIAAMVLLGVMLGIRTIKPMNMLHLGENYATTMGLDINRSRRTILGSTVLLAGTVTAFCGPIGFIGLAAPHMARMTFRSADMRTLLPGSILYGMAVMTFCDMASKMLSLPINTMTALTGIPVVAYIVVRKCSIRQ